MMHWENGWSTGDWVAMFVMMALFWSALIAVVVWVMRSMRPDRDTWQKGPSASESGGAAEQILQERFARGELTPEEFTRSRDLLHSKPGNPHESR